MCDCSNKDVDGTRSLNSVSMCPMSRLPTPQRKMYICADDQSHQSKKHFPSDIRRINAGQGTLAVVEGNASQREKREESKCWTGELSDASGGLGLRE